MEKISEIDRIFYRTRLMDIAKDMGFDSASNSYKFERVIKMYKQMCKEVGLDDSNTGE